MSIAAGRVELIVQAKGEDNVSATLKGVNQGLDRTGDKLGKAEKKATDFERGLGRLNDGVEAFGARMAVFGLAAGAVAMVTAKLLELAEAGEKAANVSVSFQSVVKNADEALGMAREATLGLVEGTDLELALSRMTRAGVDQTHQMRLLGLATKASLDQQRELPDVLKMVEQAARGEVDALKEVGVVIDQEAAIEAYARGIGIASSALTEKQRNTAKATAAIAEMQRQFDVVDTSKYQLGLQQARTSLGDLASDLSVFVSTAANNALEGPRAALREAQEEAIADLREAVKLRERLFGEERQQDRDREAARAEQAERVKAAIEAEAIERQRAHVAYQSGIQGEIDSLEDQRRKVAGVSDAEWQLGKVKAELAKLDKQTVVDLGARRSLIAQILGLEKTIAAQKKPTTGGGARAEGVLIAEALRLRKAEIEAAGRLGLQEQETVAVLAHQIRLEEIASDLKRRKVTAARAEYETRLAELGLQKELAKVEEERAKRRKEVADREAEARKDAIRQADDEARGQMDRVERRRRDIEEGAKKDLDEKLAALRSGLAALEAGGSLISSAWGSALGSIGSATEGIFAAVNANDELNAKIADGTAKTEDYEKAESAKQGAIMGGIGAAGELASAFVESEKEKAGIMALTEAAMALASYPDPVGMITHGAAAAQFAAIAGGVVPTAAKAPATANDNQPRQAGNGGSGGGSPGTIVHNHYNGIVASHAHLQRSGELLGFASQATKKTGMGRGGY